LGPTPTPTPTPKIKSIKTVIFKINYKINYNYKSLYLL